MDELNAEESQLFELLLYMTGREDRLARKPLVLKGQTTGIRAIWPILKSPTTRGMGANALANLLNRLLLSLGIKTVSLAFVETVFRDADFSNFPQIRERVERFRQLCMLEYGSFRFGFKQFRQGLSVQEKWHTCFPTDAEVTRRAQELSTRLKPVGLQHIEGSVLFSLGYLASEHAARINEARTRLSGILERALQAGVSDYPSLRGIAGEQEEKGLAFLLARVGIPETGELLAPGEPGHDGGSRSFADTLRSLHANCVPVDEEAIRRARDAGLQNARTYMAMHDLDVYVATSMRDPLHFTTNWSFVQGLFHGGTLGDWHLRYFDPTQAFLPNRIQKGLLECLMIKRARLTVYNAQEADTFGKDAEAGVTLAQGKPVIVYVARLFERLPELQPVYRALDEGTPLERDAFIDLLGQRGLLDAEDQDALRAAEKSTADAIARVVEKHVPGAIQGLGEDGVALELIRQGYDPQRADQDLVKFASERVLLLERRALTFRVVHPLSLQTSPMDGVARGVIVTRNLEDTAKVVSGLFLGTLAYDIVQDEDNWLLVDQVTRSPVRVVTKDPVLTTAFWSETWGQGRS